MSKQLFLSSALSVLMMAAYALFGPHSLAAPEGLVNPIGEAQAASVLRQD